MERYCCYYCPLQCKEYTDLMDLQQHFVVGALLLQSVGLPVNSIENEIPTAPPEAPFAPSEPSVPLAPATP